MMSADIAVYGLGVMGRNIALNMADQGHHVAVYNHTTSRVDNFLSFTTKEQQITACYDIEQMIESLALPRTIFLMVTAGKVVDQVIDSLIPHLAPGDIIIDGGNSHYQDTERRWKSLKQRGFRFLGLGISGGEEGARQGPSIMPGGDPEAWPFVESLFQSIAAKADDGQACCRWVGEGGAGHYVKMVHNGIEYGDMQLIAEAWHLMRDGLGLAADDLADIFSQWNQGTLSSYLIEITADILRVRDPDGSTRVENILDAAGQKGTGRWTAIDSLQLGVPLTLICESVYARALSSMKDERRIAAQKLGGRPEAKSEKKEALLPAIEHALYAAKIISYTQGFMQMREAAKEYDWNLEFGNIALLWRAGCIIRSRFLNDIKQAYEKKPDLKNLLLDDFFAEAIQIADQGLRDTVAFGIQQAIPLPTMCAALAFYDGYRSAVLPANLLQAQRDYFGAHTYKRLNDPSNKTYHTHWTSDKNEESIDD